MRKLLIALMVVHACLAIPRFTFLSSRSSNAFPQIHVEFDNGISDRLVLNQYQLHAKSTVLSPSYIGHLANHPSSAAVTQDLDGLWHVSLFSEHNQDARFFQVDTDGKVKLKSMTSAIGKYTVTPT